MFRRNLHRGITAMVFVAALALGGARPAAAQGPVWREALDWLGRLWSSVTMLQPSYEAAGGDCGMEIDPDGRPCPKPIAAPAGDCGPEIDPNGHCKP